MRTCPDCKEQLAADAFGKGATYCRPCHNLRGRQSRERHGGNRYYHLKRRYGIGKTEFLALLEAQDNKCAICGKPDPTHLDHEHVGKEEIGAKGRVRGVLCVPCNNGLGLFRDSPDLLRAAADYLEQ